MPRSVWVEEADTRTPLNETFHDFLITINVSSKTRETYTIALEMFRRFLCTLLQREPVLGDFTKPNVASFRNNLEESKKEPGTVHHRLRVLKRFSKWLNKEGYTTVDILLTLEMPRNPVKPKRALTGEEAKQLLSACTNKRDQAIVALMLDAGLRREEVCNLELDDLNLRDYTAKVVGKGRKTRLVSVPMAARFIRQWLLIRPDSEWPNVFLTIEGDLRPITTNCVRMIFRRLKEKTNIEGLTPHKLRHTMATWLYDDTNDLVEVQEILGHNDIQTTRRYLHRDAQKVLQIHRQHSPLAKMLKNRGER